MIQPGWTPRGMSFLRIHSNTELKQYSVKDTLKDGDSRGAFSLSSFFKTLNSTLANKGAVIAIALLLGPTGVLLSVLKPYQTTYAAPSRGYLNFQARLLTSTGGVVQDGYYNIEFKLYDALTSSGSSQGSCTGDTNCKWVESYYDTNGVTAGNDFRVRVVNGYFSVNLGSQAAFAGVDWSQQLYLTMNIGGTTQTATPTYDGEMTPRIALTAVPVALNALGVNSGTTSVASTPSANVSIKSGDTTNTTSNSGTVTLQSGNVTSGNSGNITIDTGTASGTTGTITLGASNASALTLGRTSFTTSVAGSLTVAQALTVTPGIITGANSETFSIGATDAVFVLGRNNAGPVTLIAADNDANADLIVAGGGTGNTEIGTNSNGQITIRTSSSDIVYFKNGSNVNRFTFQGGALSQDFWGTTSGVLHSISSTSGSTTQNGAYIGQKIDLSTNITVPNSASGNQTGLLVTTKDGGASAASIGISLAGTYDTGINFGGTASNLIAGPNNFSLSAAGVITLPGGQTNDITTLAAATANAISLKPGTSSGASSNGAAVTIKGGDGSGTTTVVGGALTLQAGSATSGSGTRTGGALSLDAGFGGVAGSNGGALTVGSINASSVGIGNSNAVGTFTASTLNLNAGTILGNASTLNLFNTVATSINFAGGATGTLAIGNTAGTTSFASNLTVATGKSFTFNGDVFTDLTGSGLVVNSNALTVDATSSTGFFRNGGNSFSTGAMLGTNDSNSLTFRTNGQSAATIAVGGATTFQNASNSTAAFQIQNSSSASLLTVDTNNSLIVLNAAEESLNQYNNANGGIGQTQNLVTFSEQFDNAGWTKTNVTATADQTFGPDNYNNSAFSSSPKAADQLATTSSGGLVNQAYTTAAIGNYTLSIWLKTGSGTQNVDLRIDSTGTNAQTGTIKTVTATTTWQRFFVTQNITGPTISTIVANIFPGGSGGSTGVVEYAYGAELNQGTQLLVYTRTTTTIQAQNQGVISNGGVFASALNATDTPLVVQASPTQSADLVSIQSSAAASLFKISSTGLATASTGFAVNGVSGTGATCGGGTPNYTPTTVTGGIITAGSCTGTVSTGTGSANQVAYFSGASTLTSNAGLTYNGGQLGINNSSATAQSTFYIFANNASNTASTMQVRGYTGEGIVVQPYDAVSHAAISVRDSSGAYMAEWRMSGEFRSKDTGIGLSFLSDSTTGIGRTGASALAVYTGNVARLSIDSGGAATFSGSVTVGGNQFSNGTDSWLRTSGNTGWYNSTYAGGWNMYDSTWIRSYGSKAVYMDQGFDTASAGSVGCGAASTPGAGYNLKVCGTQYTTGNLTVGGAITTNGVTSYYGYTGRAGIGGATSNWMNTNWTGTCIQQWVDSSNFGNIMCPSDQRVKKNIQTLTSAKGLDAIRQLNPVTFNWNAPGSPTGTEYGFIAQQVRDVLPDLVFNTGMITAATPDGMLRLDYNGLFSVVVKGIQEQQAQLDVIAGGNFSGNLSVAGYADITGTLTVQGDTTLAKLTVTGDTEVQKITINGKIITGGTAPAVVLGLAAGDTHTAVGTLTGNDTAGSFSITTGTTGTVANQILGSVTFTSPYDKAPTITVTPTSQDAAGIRFYLVKTTTGWSINVIDAPLANKTYSFDYHVIQ